MGTRLLERGFAPVQLDGFGYRRLSAMSTFSIRVKECVDSLFPTAVVTEVGAGANTLFRRITGCLTIH